MAAHAQRDDADQQDHRDQQRRFPAIRHQQADRLGQAAPGETGQQDADRGEDQQAEDAGQMALDIGREEQAGEETEDHRRQRLHQLDHRLDLAAHGRGHEIGGVDGRGNRQRRRQQHRIERGFEGAERQRREAQFGLVVGAGGGRLPDIVGLVVVFVPDLAPQRTPGHLRVRVVDQQALQLPLRLDQHTVGPRRQAGQGGACGQRLDQQGAVRGAVEDAQVAFGIQGHEALAPLFRENLGDGAVAHLEAADRLQVLLAVLVADHEPLLDGALAVADHQRDAAEQRGRMGDVGGAVAEQLVAAVQLLGAQAEHIRRGAAVDHVQPLVARVDDQRLDRLGDLRQSEAILAEGHLAGHQVFFAAQAQHMQIAAGGGGQQQAAAVQADADVIQRAALLVETDRGFAERVVDPRRNGFHVVRVTDRVGMLEHQHLAVGQPQGHPVAARLIEAHGSHLGIGRQRQGYRAQQGHALGIEKLHLATLIEAHGHLVLFFHRHQQGFAGIRQPGWLHRLARIELSPLEHRQDDVGQVEEDQGDGAQHRQAANGNTPAGQVILERTHAPLAQQGRGVEVQPQGLGRGGHGFTSQVIHSKSISARP
ncbi:hypothetical protein D3C84_495360 [compost metagenome]